MEQKKPSKFQEYLDLYKKGITEFDKVIASRWNSALNDFNKLDPAKKAEAERRLAICEKCPFMSKNAEWGEEYKAYFGHYYSTNRSEEHCCLCKCPLEYKTLAMDDKCGADWFNANERKPNQPELSVLWENF